MEEVAFLMEKEGKKATAMEGEDEEEKQLRKSEDENVQMKFLKALASFYNVHHPMRKLHAEGHLSYSYG